jgi:hypothetical protein
MEEGAASQLPNSHVKSIYLKFQLGHVVDNFKLNLLLLKIWNLVDK